MTAPETLKTVRLTLRKPQAEDAPLIFAAYAQDAEVTRYLTWRPHQTADEARGTVERLLAQWQDGTAFSWMLFARDDSTLVGCIAARLEGHRVDLGYVLARSHWGRGLMTEAVRAVTEWAFTNPSVFRVWAVCDVENAASARVLEKAGFRCEGILRKWSRHPNLSDMPRDCYCYALVRDVFAAMP